MTNGPLIVSFVGSSGAGKTTVIEHLVPLLRAQGLRVGTMKHASHGHEVDRVGSDSWRHRQAGAEIVLLAGADGAVVFLAPQPTPVDTTPTTHHEHGASASTSQLVDLAGRFLTDVDVVLAEGYAPLNDVLIEVRRREVPRKASTSQHEVWLAITDEPNGGHDEYPFDQIDAVAARIVDRVQQE